VYLPGRLPNLPADTRLIFKTISHIDTEKYIVKYTVNEIIQELVPLKIKVRELSSNMNWETETIVDVERLRRMSKQLYAIDKAFRDALYDRNTEFKDPDQTSASVENKSGLKHASKPAYAVPKSVVYRVPDQQIKVKNLDIP